MPAAVVGEEKLDQAAGLGVGERTAGGALGHDPVDEGERLLVERHHPLRLELAERHLEPGAGACDLVHAVELEVEQLADPQPGRALQQQRVGAQPVGGGLERGDEATVGVGRQVAGQRPRQARERRGGRRAGGAAPAASPTR